MEVNSIVNNPYRATKKDAAIGAGVGLAATAYQYGLVSANFMGLKGATISAKKDRLDVLRLLFRNTKLFDMSKTTVSKVVKSAQKAVLSVPNVAKNVAIFAGIGAGIGLVSDFCKSHKEKVNAKKSQAV